MTEPVERMLPLYEAKMIHHYDHRWATYERDGSTRNVTLEEKHDPEFVVMPRYWVREDVVKDRLEGDWDHDWLLGWRDICRSTDERTMISTINGAGASPEGGTLLTLCDPPDLAPILVSHWNSYAFDYVARQKVSGTHLKYFTVRQLPVLPPSMSERPSPWSIRDRLGTWLEQRVLALVLDARDMAALAQDFDRSLAVGAWDINRRQALRAEIDAAMFHLYGVERDDVDYIMETFPIVKR